MPCSISIPLLVEVSITLLISYNWLGNVVKPTTLSTVIWFKFLSMVFIVPVPSITCWFLFKILNVSPSFKLDLSMGALKEYVVPVISICNLDDVLYFQELANISL